MVEIVDACPGSMNVTPSAVATATRLTELTRMPGSVPSAMAASSAVRVSPLPGLPRTTVVPGDAASSLAW